MKLSFNVFNPDVLLSEPSQARNLKKVFSRDSSFPQDMPIEQKQMSFIGFKGSVSRNLTNFKQREQPPVVQQIQKEALIYELEKD